MPTPDRPLEAAIAEYLIACEVENKSPRTVQAYAETLRVFMRWVAGEPRVPTVATFAVADAYRFLKAVADSGVAAGTRHRRFRDSELNLRLIHVELRNGPLIESGLNDDEPVATPLCRAF